MKSISRVRPIEENKNNKKSKSTVAFTTLLVRSLLSTASNSVFFFFLGYVYAHSLAGEENIFLKAGVCIFIYH